MFNSLYVRLATSLVLLVLLLSGVYIVVTLQSVCLYSQELNQKFNQQLAANLIKENHLTLTDGRFDAAALEHIFHAYMVVNPSIEVYLLDVNGRILSYSAPPGTVKRERVNLQPVRSFLNDGSRLPILGDDPRNLEVTKVFSAAPIGPAQQPQGYLYVVLNGEQLESVASMLQGSYIMRALAYALGVSALVGLIGGLWLLHLVTRRLRRLDKAMADFEAAGFTEFSPSVELDTQPHDELGRLGHTFTAMAERISNHLGTVSYTHLTLPTIYSV